MGMANELRVWVAALLAGAVACGLLGGCGDGMGLNAPGEYDKVQLGKPLPADIQKDCRREGLGMGLRREGRQFLTGQSRAETFRVLVDDKGKVVAGHCLRTWDRHGLLGPKEAKARFVLDVRVPDANAPAGGAAIDRPLDEPLLALGRSLAMGVGKRGKLPSAWPDVAPWLLHRLNERRTGQGQAPATALPEGAADLLLVAEVLLESVQVDGGDEMDRAAWKDLDLAEALKEVPRRLPRKKGDTFSWSQVDTRDNEGFVLTMGLPFLVHLAEDRYRTSGSLTNLGAGHVRLVLQGERIEQAGD
jgi:hypothetical protein